MEYSEGDAGSSVCIEDVRETVTKYEEFVNDRLKGDLGRVHEQRDSIYKEIAEYLQLQKTILIMDDYCKQCQEDGKPEHLKTMMDLGQNFYCQAVIPRCERLFVLLGNGLYVEMTRAEALAFIDKKVSLLTNKVDLLTRDSAKIKAHIKLVLEGLRELQLLEFGTQEDRRELFG